MKEYNNCSFEEFPHSLAMSEGIQILEVKEDEPSCRVLCDVPCREVDGRNLHLHIILPTQEKNIEKRYPLVMYVQGSAWRVQSTGKELAQLCRFAQKGYVVAIVQYRDAAWQPFPAQIIDAKWAIDYMVNHSEQYFVDVNHISIWGDSSGGHTAVMSAFTKDLVDFMEPGLKEYMIESVIDYYAPSDISRMDEEPTTNIHYVEESPEGVLLGGQYVDAKTAEKTVIMNYIDEKELPPILIVHGSKDRQVPFHQSVLLYDKLKQENKEVEAYQLHGADHGGAPFWNKQVLDIVDNFIQKHQGDN